VSIEMYRLNPMITIYSMASYSMFFVLAVSIRASSRVCCCSFDFDVLRDLITPTTCTNPDQD
jgi:hypothetical protein